MNDKIDPGMDAQPESTATETTPSPVAEPRKPLVLGRSVVRVLKVRSGVQTGEICKYHSIFKLP